MRCFRCQTDHSVDARIYLAVRAVQWILQEQEWLACVAVLAVVPLANQVQLHCLPQELIVPVLEWPATASKYVIWRPPDSMGMHYHPILHVHFRSVSRIVFLVGRPDKTSMTNKTSYLYGLIIFITLSFITKYLFSLHSFMNKKSWMLNLYYFFHTLSLSWCGFGLSWFLFWPKLIQFYVSQIDWKYYKIPTNVTNLVDPDHLHGA